MTIPEEKIVKDYENYLININGYVKRINLKFGKSPIKILKNRMTSSGYYYVSLTNNKKAKNKLVHRLLAEAFIPNPDNKSSVNHKDGNKLNNNLSNLEWVTKSENTLHAYKNNLLKAPSLGKFGKNNKKSRKVVQLSLNSSIINVFYSGKEASEKTNTLRSEISECCNKINNRETANGFKWRFFSDKTFTKEQIKQIAEYYLNK